MAENVEGLGKETVQCRQCGRSLSSHEERIKTEQGAYCTTCYGILKGQVEQSIRAQGDDINYLMAVVGAVGGGALGAAIWWGFTVLTNIAFGLVAVVIGWLVARGILMTTGGKRTLNLQILSVVVSALAFFYGSFLVNRSLSGLSEVVPLLPSWEVFYRLVAAGFSIMDVVFLGIVVWEAWRGVAPLRMAARASE